MEHSERGAYVTHLVSVWIENDGDHADHALSLAHRPDVMGSWLILLLQSARPHMAPWHTRQELAPNDYGRINWADVASNLLSE